MNQVKLVVPAAWAERVSEWCETQEYFTLEVGQNLNGSLDIMACWPENEHMMLTVLLPALRKAFPAMSITVM